MARYHLWPLGALLLVILLHAFLSSATEEEEILSGLLPIEARNADNSQEEDIISTSYVLPNQIFNDGKPYYASKDPISGQLDFSAKKPAGIDTELNEVVNLKEKIILNTAAPNIHDYLNLPVKYSSSKFVYPLVSSSYANLKYQGSNKNYITNKKPTSIVAPVTPPPNYQSLNYYTVPTTKLMAVPPTATGLYSTTGTTATTTTTVTTTTTAHMTSKKPTITTTISTSPNTTTKIKTITTPPTRSKYTTIQSTSKRRPVVTSPLVGISTTRKKFVPAKKYNTTTASISTTPIRFLEPWPANSTLPPKPKSTTATIITTPPTTTTTETSTSPSPSFPSDKTFTTQATQAFNSSSIPSVGFKENTTALPVFSPFPSSTLLPNLDSADVYQSVDQKNTVPQMTQKKPPMTLADIFNSLAEEETVASSNYQQIQGFDAQINLIEPIAPSQPSPFVVQQFKQSEQPHVSYPSTGTIATAPALQQKQLLGQRPTEQQQNANDQKLISNSQVNYNNEYVSYQVQQPNMMQYRPTSGAINNVVISPSQNSASFVLGSQQQIGANAFSSAKIEPLFLKNPSVQYGTVINEDISSIKRPNQVTEQTASQIHPHSSTVSGTFVHYQKPPPQAPLPYQQLPLIDSNLRPSKSSQQPQPPQQPQQQNDRAQQAPINFAKLPSSPFRQTQQEASQISINGNDTRELLVSTNIRFPANEEKEAVQMLSASVAHGPPAALQINGHAQPLSLQQIQNTNPIVFPKTKNDDQSKYDESVDVQIQQHQVLTMNQHKQKLSFPQQSDQISPSQHMEPPPRFPPAMLNTQSPDSGNRHHGPTQFTYKQYTRNPIPVIARPNVDRNLPNILPQFRPNAKISNGHPPSYKQEAGNIRLHGQAGLKRTNQSPQFARRRQPLMQQHRHSVNRISEYPPPPPLSQLPQQQTVADINRRVYRLPPYGGQGIQYLDRMYPRHRPPVQLQQKDYTIERHATIPQVNTEPYKTIANENLTDFQEEDLVINDPPQPITPSKEPNASTDETKLEPVITLQMLQSQRKVGLLPNDDTGSGEIQVMADGDMQNNVQIREQNKDSNGLYVVYPMKANKQDGSEPAEIKEPLPAVAHIEAPSGSDYQNTPFSVIRDQPQEPILIVKSKKPQSLQQKTKAQTLKETFPYPIEKPDQLYSELNSKARVPGVVIAPRIINGAYGSGTASPIAIAYTPTEPNPQENSGQTTQHTHKLSNVNLASTVINEIRNYTEAQTKDNLNKDFNLYGQNYEKNFMAPFYPSINLENAANPTPANSWNILPSTTLSSIHDKHNINRADIVNEEKKEPDMTESATIKLFELDSFQPELQGGFKPIYPLGYKQGDSEDSREDDHIQKHESNNLPLALPLSNSLITSRSNIGTSTTITTSRPQINTIINTDLAMISATLTSNTATPAAVTPEPIQHKSSLETSLAALLFGDENESDDDDAHNSKTKFGPRMMAPRSLQFR